MVDKRISSLAEQTTLNYEDKAVLDRVPGLSEAKSISFDTALRSEVGVSEDARTVSFYLLNYQFKDRITATIDRDCTFSFSNIPVGSTNYLRVIKGVNDLVGFTGITGVIDSKQIGETSITYRIERRDTSFYVNRIDNQFTDSLVIGNLTSTFGTISDFSFFKSTTNNNICNFEASFNFTTTGSISLFLIDIANWDVSKFNPNYAPISISASVGAVGLVVADARIKADELLIQLDSAVDNDILIIINGSFRIK